MKTFKDYREEINLVDFALSYGYSIQKDKSTANAVVLKEKSKYDDTIIVRYDKVKKNYFYTNPHDSRDKGDIINFVCSRNGWDMRQNARFINEELSKFTGSYVPTPYKIEPSNDIPRKDLVKTYFKTNELTDRKFLHSRGISDDTMDSFLFGDKVYNTPIIDGTGKVHINTCFPMFSEFGEIIGLELKNDKFKGNGIGSDKSNSLWYSNHDTRSKIDEFIIGESALDLLSHYQLNREKIDNKNVLYISTSGNLADGQVIFIQKLINLRQPDQITMAFDNDLPGVRLQSNLIGSLSKPKYHFDGKTPRNDFFSSHHDIQANVSLKGKYNAVAKFEIAFTDALKGKVKVDEIINRFENLNTNPDEKNFNSSLIVMGDNKATIEVGFKNNMSNLLQVENEIKQIRSLDNFVEIDRPINKDFNDDLKQKLGIGKEDQKLEVLNKDIVNKEKGVGM